MHFVIQHLFVCIDSVTVPALAASAAFCLVACCAIVSGVMLRTRWKNSQQPVEDIPEEEQDAESEDREPKQVEAAAPKPDYASVPQALALQATGVPTCPRERKYDYETMDPVQYEVCHGEAGDYQNWPGGKDQ